MKSETLKKKDRTSKEKDIASKEKGILPTHYYIDPARFRTLILEYYDSNDFSEELGEMINKISEHAAYRPNFRTYTYISEMISDSNYKMVKALIQKKYDPSKGYAFPYFAKICYRSFITVIKKERRAADTVSRYQDEIYDEMVLTGLDLHHTGNTMGDEHE